MSLMRSFWTTTTYSLSLWNAILDSSLGPGPSGINWKPENMVSLFTENAYGAHFKDHDTSIIISHDGWSRFDFLFTKTTNKLSISAVHIDQKIHPISSSSLFPSYSIKKKHFVAVTNCQIWVQFIETAPVPFYRKVRGGSLKVRFLIVDG